MPECQRCGQCCHKFGISLTIEDMNREPRLWEVAVPLERVGNQKMRLFMMQNNYRWVIGGKPYRGAPCVFLQNNECLIYRTRPQICRDYPQEAECIKEVQEV